VSDHLFNGWQGMRTVFFHRPCCLVLSSQHNIHSCFPEQTWKECVLLTVLQSTKLWYVSSLQTVRLEQDSNLSLLNLRDFLSIHRVPLRPQEQQTISIAKAGITTVLNSRSSVLAAANPVFGRYDDLKSASENIDLMSTILSRFDLIFLVRDVRDEVRDRMICRHVMGVHIGNSGGRSGGGDGSSGAGLGAFGGMSDGTSETELMAAGMLGDNSLQQAA
jgi:hypothetical protein